MLSAECVTKSTLPFFPSGQISSDVGWPVAAAINDDEQILNIPSGEGSGATCLVLFVL